ncbi:MAG: cyclase family protein [Xanthomonadales bacterium]|nr:cyclase family protein [Xanthomonadales bacterium]
MNRAGLWGLLGALIVESAFTQVIDFEDGQWQDLSHPYSEETLYWPTSDTFHKETVFEGHTEGGWYYTAYSFTTAEHGGTHIDAPIHFFEGRKTVDQLAVSQLIGPAIVIDVRAAVSQNPDYQVSARDLELWEALHGPIPGGSIVLINTGFAERWPDAAAYLGTAERGESAVPLLHFPGLQELGARLLVERGIKAVGLDTASIDYGQSRDFISHRVLFEANIPAFENLADLSAIPATGSFVVAMPMKIENGSGAPLRVAAFVPAD